MSKIVHLSEAASAGLHAAVLLASKPERAWSVRELANKIGASEAHLAKVIQRLAKNGLVHTTRGPKGGIVLAPPYGEITFLQVYEAIEGPLQAQSCLLRDKGNCPFGSCIFGSMLEQMAYEIRENFAKACLGNPHF